MSDEDKQHINLTRPDKVTVLSDVLAAVEKKRQLCLQKRWKLKKNNGEQIILRDLCDKMVVWINKFKEVGDIVAQYNPGHASLPWAAVRFILQAGGYTSVSYSTKADNVRRLSMTVRYLVR